MPPKSGHTRTPSSKTMSLPRRLTKGPLDDNQDSLHESISVSSPQRSSSVSTSSNKNTKPLPEFAATEETVNPGRVSDDRKNANENGSRSGKDFGYLRSADTYHPLPLITSSPSPSPSTTTSNIHSTALSSARTLTNSSISLSPREIFALVYTRLSSLSILDINLAAQEAKVLGDTGSEFYYESAFSPGGDDEEEGEGGGKEGGDDDNFDEKSGRRRTRRKKRENILPWPLRLLAVRLQSIAYKDPKAGILGYYDLAREARGKIKEIRDPRRDTHSGDDDDDSQKGVRDGDEADEEKGSKKGGKELNEEIVWENRLKELGIWVVNAMIEMGDFVTARRFLEEERLRMGCLSVRRKKEKSIPAMSKYPSGALKGSSQEKVEKSEVQEKPNEDMRESEEIREDVEASQQDEDLVNLEEERLITARLALLSYQMGDNHAFSKYLSLLRPPSSQKKSSTSASSSSSHLLDLSPNPTADPLPHDPFPLLSLLSFSENPSATAPLQPQSIPSTLSTSPNSQQKMLLTNNGAISLLYEGKISEATTLLEGVMREGEEEEGDGMGGMGDVVGMKRMEGVRFNLGKMGELMGRG